jgi:hypothetical protein
MCHRVEKRVSFFYEALERYGGASVSSLRRIDVRGGNLVGYRRIDEHVLHTVPASSPSTSSVIVLGSTGGGEVIGGSMNSPAS